MALRSTPASSYFLGKGKTQKRLLVAFGVLALTGVLLGALSPGGTYAHDGWASAPGTIDLWISSILILGAWAVFKFRPHRMRWVGMALSGAASLRYLTWRLTYTLSFNDPVSGIFSVLLFAAEIYTVVMLFSGHFQAFRPIRRTSPEMPSDARWPSVDVYITTLDESVDVVRRTAVGCRAMRYGGRKKVWVLDDGSRVEMRRLAEQLGIGYLSRKDRRAAKAGNLNEAMARTSGELIAQFDADHVPVRSFLEETVPFLVADDNLAFVQTPHQFQNSDIYQRNLAVGSQVANEQDLFFRVLQPGADFWNAAYFCVAKGGREEMAENERAELAVIQEFLPQLADAAQTRAWVEAAIAESGASSPKEMGKVMGALMKAHKADIDGNLAREIVQELLAS